MVPDTQELEHLILAGLMKQDDIGDDSYNIAGLFIKDEDWSNKTKSEHGVLFNLIKQSRDAGEKPNKVIIAQKLTELGVVFKSGISPLQYLDSLELRRCTKENVIQAIKELKKFSLGRQTISNLRRLEREITDNIANISSTELVKLIDSRNVQVFSDFFGDKDEIIDIYGEMENMVEDRGNNPLIEDGPRLDGWGRLQGTYGSLFTPEDITVIVARSGVGKTTMCLDFSAQISAKYSLPVIHLDNGEMSHEKLIFRQCAAATGVPFDALFRGTFRQNTQFTKMVREYFQRLKAQAKPQIFYVDVGGKSVDEILNTIRRVYFSKIGRGKKAIISYDYIKTSFEKGNKEEHAMVGEIVDKFKQFIKTEMKFDGKPVLSMLTSVQANRYGEGDNAVSLSDRIKQFSSKMFLLSKKSVEELALDPCLPDGKRPFGTHRLENLKCRQAGEDYERICPVKLIDSTLQENYIHLSINNFCCVEHGDLIDMVDYQMGKIKAK